jgi:threonine/homoserine efflux transporter RhtA
MGRMPLTSVLLTAGCLWALYLWRNHRLGGLAAAGPGLLSGGAVDTPPLGTLRGPTDTYGGGPVG